MSKSINSVTILGNLGRDPEIRTANSGLSICTFSVATTESRKGKSGEWEEFTEWHNVKLFGNDAQYAATYAKKGNRVAIEGRLQTDAWDDKATGAKKYKTYIIAEDLVLLSGKETATSGEGGSTTGGGFDAAEAVYSPQGQSLEDLGF